MKKIFIKKTEKMKSVNQLKMQMFRLAVVLSVFVLGFHSVIKADPVDVEKAKR
jgi:hypothetical protein